jgi:3-mercaptopyruvate sulfurtransferase SseA
MRDYLTGIHKNARNMSGGFKAWKTAGWPVTK